MPTKRKPISKKTRFEVFKRDSFTCQYCGRSAPETVLHLDHIQPISKNGDDSLFNYITACIDCNQGKGNRELSDDSAIKKQKAQLDELNERREQLEMLVAWRNGLADLGEIELKTFAEAWSKTVPGFYLSPNGLFAARKLLNTYGLARCLDALPHCLKYICIDNKTGNATASSAESAWNKLPGILRGLSLPEWKQRLFHIRNVALVGYGYHNSTRREVFDLFERLWSLGWDLDDLMEIAREHRNYTSLTELLNQHILTTENSTYEN